MKAAAMRYADLLENGCFITHHEQDEIAKLLRRLVMTEDEAWNELERKQNKKTQTTKVDWEAVAADQAMTIALAQPEQEPVAAIELVEIGSEQVIAVAWYDSNAFKVGTKLYTALPSKPWIGLDNLDFQYQTPHDVIVMRYAEAILKEKNT